MTCLVTRQRSYWSHYWRRVRCCRWRWRRRWTFSLWRCSSRTSSCLGRARGAASRSGWSAARSAETPAARGTRIAPPVKKHKSEKKAFLRLRELASPRTLSLRYKKQNSRLVENPKKIRVITSWISRPKRHNKGLENHIIRPPWHFQITLPETHGGD